MMYETRKPNIKLSVHESWFNVLITALTENAKVKAFPHIAEDANALIDKLMKYSRPFIDNDNLDCVDIRFFPDEASKMIWQLLIGCSNSREASEDFYARLKETHIPNERKNKTE